VLLSSYLGELGPTARWLIGLGSHATGVVPRDLRNAITEVTQQRNQLALMRRFLPRLNVPVHVVHGEMDDFAPIETARRLVQETRTKRPLRFHAVPDANHFFNDGPVEHVLYALEQCIPAPKPAWTWRWPSSLSPTGLFSATQPS
jgi:pimeloyl-ACP methyl ester carboxylesterase